eukprot:2531887-Prymnesium_polylepis.1
MNGISTPSSLSSTRAHRKAWDIILPRPDERGSFSASGKQGTGTWRVPRGGARCRCEFRQSAIKTRLIGLFSAFTPR